MGKTCRKLLISLLVMLVSVPQVVSAAQVGDNADAVLAQFAEAGLTVEGVQAEDANGSWDGLGMFSEDSTRLLSALSEPFGVETYAFGDSKANPPIIEPSGSLPVAAGATVLTVPDDWATPASGMGGSMAFAAAGGGSVAPGDEVLFLWTEFDSDYDFSQTDLTINEGFPITVPGLPVWNSTFAGDTWEGANLIPNAVYDGATLTFDVKSYQPPQSFPLVDIPGFYYRSGNVMAMALDADVLASYGETAGAVNGFARSAGEARTLELAQFVIAFFVHLGQGGLFVPGFIALGLLALELTVLTAAVMTSFLLISLIPPPATTAAPTTTTAATTTAAPSTTTPVATTQPAPAPAVVEDSQPAPEPAPASTATTDPEDGAIPLRLLIVLIGIGLFVAGLFFYSRSRKKGKYVGGTRVRKKGDDLHSTPRGSKPPVHTDTTPACDWALVFIGDTQSKYLRQPAPGKVECCTYYIKIESSVWWHDQAASFRQDTPPDRQYIPDIDFAFDGIGYKHNASTRSGPAGRQDWQHGAGNPIDQSALDEDAGFWQRAQGEERPEVVAQVYHQEATRVKVWLEAGCTDHQNLFESRSDGEVVTLLTSECTNDAPEESCPVELTAQGLHSGSVFGDLKYGFGDWTGSDIDELERYAEEAEDNDEWRLPLPDPSMVNPGRWDGHVHDTSLQTPTREQSFSSSDHRVMDEDRFWTQFNTTSWCETAQLVPEAVHDTTERVSSHADARFEYNLWLRGTMKKPLCVDGQCKGHPGHTCHDEPTFELMIDQSRQQVVVDGLFHYFERTTPGDRHNPPPIGPWRRWELL